MRGTESEGADDLPGIIDRLGIEKLIDREFSSPHGNRQGLSYVRLDNLYSQALLNQGINANFTYNVGLKALGFTSEMKGSASIEQRSTTNNNSNL